LHIVIQFCYVQISLTCCFKASTDCQRCIHPQTVKSYPVWVFLWPAIHHPLRRHDTAHLLQLQSLLHCVSHKNVQTLASCSFNKYGVIWIILCKHQHTSKNDMHIQLSLCLHFYLFYLLLNSYNGKDAKQRVFLGRLLVALKRAGCVVYWLWKVSVLVQQMFKVMSFCLLHWPTASVFCDVLDHMSLMHCIKSLVSQSCVLYNVHTVLHHSPNSAVNWVSGSTGLCGGHKYAEIK